MTTKQIKEWTTEDFANAFDEYNDHMERFARSEGRENRKVKNPWRQHKHTFTQG